jgi:hypothetical protein
MLLRRLRGEENAMRPTYAIPVIDDKKQRNNESEIPSGILGTGKTLLLQEWE